MTHSKTSKTSKAADAKATPAKPRRVSTDQSVESRTADRTIVNQIHPDDRLDPSKSDIRHMRYVAVNQKESPLNWLYARGLVSDAQLLAGEKLRADFERSGLAPRVTMRWDAPPRQRKSGGNYRLDSFSLARIDSLRYFHAAIDAVGPGLADICWRVICAGEGLTEAENALGWPRRAGRLVLTMALDRLVHHYGNTTHRPTKLNLETELAA